MALDHRSEDKLLGVHPDLVRVMRAAAERTKFRITEGLRDQMRQAELVRSGKSKTQNSRHLTGHAVDIIAIGEDGIATYDMEDMQRVAGVIREAAADLGIPIEWGAAAKYGGDFKTFNDSPHFQLPWKQYPAIGVSTTTRAIEVAKAPPGAAATGVAVGAGAVSAVPSLPAIPAPPDLSAYNAWRSFGDAVGDLGGWVISHPILTTVCVAWVSAMTFLPQIWERVKWRFSSLSS